MKSRRTRVRLLLVIIVELGENLPAYGKIYAMHSIGETNDIEVFILLQTVVMILLPIVIGL